VHFVGVCRALGINIARNEQYKVHNFSKTASVFYFGFARWSVI